ncbi:MAG: hypothetical protein LUD22_00285 [Coprobacillus sp.]|nr:hypothetical protein [Coprobacillus sp.]
MKKGLIILPLLLLSLTACGEIQEETLTEDSQEATTEEEEKTPSTEPLDDASLISAAKDIVSGLFESQEDDNYVLNWEAFHYKDRTYEYGLDPDEDEDYLEEGYFTSDTNGLLYGYRSSEYGTTIYQNGTRTTGTNTVNDSTTYAELFEECEDDYLLMGGSKGIPELESIVSSLTDTIPEGISIEINGSTLKLTDYTEVPDASGAVASDTYVFEVSAGEDGELISFAFSFEQYVPLTVGNTGTIVELRDGEETLFEKIDASEVVLPL